MYSIYIFIHNIDVTDFEKPVLESNKVVVIINEKHWGVFRLQVLQDDNFLFWRNWTRKNSLIHINDTSDNI